MNVWIKLAIVILLLLLFFWSIYSPYAIKPILLIYYPDIQYELSKDAIEYKEYTLYSNKSKNSAKKLIICFKGGAFLFANRQPMYGLLNSLHDKLSHVYDILVFDYPVRFKHTLQQSLLRINAIIRPHLQYESYYGLGMSAGALLLGTFIQKESSINISKAINVPQIGLKFESFIGLNGIYNTKFDAPLLNKLFSFYILRGTMNSHLYTCSSLPLPKLIVSCANDFLVSQTQKFILHEHATYKIFDNPELTHVFPLYQHLAETKETIDMIIEFLSNDPEVATHSDNDMPMPVNQD